MSSSALKLLAASGAKGSATYVDDVFSTTLYTGDNSTQTVTTGIDVLGEGGLIWVKARSFAGGHNLIDSAQGSSYNLDSTSVNAPANNSTQFTFLNNGYRINGGSTAWDLNQNNQDYCAWSWQKQPGFFDVVTFEAPANADDDFRVSHNLGTVPGMIIVKSVDATGDWYVYHRSLSTPRNDSLKLNTNGASAASGDFWGESNPTATDFGVQVRNFATRPVTTGAGTYVAYLFAHDAQDFGTDEDEAIIKCDSYTGNGNANGPVIDLGFEPQFILMRYPAGANWYIYDSMRGIVTGGNEVGLNPNAAGTGFDHNALSLTASGFQITTDNGNYNGNGEKYIYMAIRRPNKPAEEFAATDLFSVTASTNTTPMYVSGFPADMTINKYVTDTSGPYIWSRLTQDQRLATSSTGQESTDAGFGYFAFSNGMTKNGYDGVSTDRKAYLWRRAPGYFDVTTYTGVDTNNTQIAHNLGVVPEMIWAKSRSDSQSWSVLTYDGTTGRQLILDASSSGSTPPSGSVWGNGTSFVPPTSSVFTIGDYSNINTSGATYIAYLFASVAGISKVGSYTGTGNDLNVDCGFSAGARFVLIKRTDSTGDWYVYDSARGIVAGNDPYFFLNDQAAQVTNTDYIDPLASGFTVTSSAPAALNNNGGTYIFYATA